MGKPTKNRELAPEEVAISIDGVSKYFAPAKGQGSIKQAFTSLMHKKSRKAKDEGYWALKDVSFQVKKGEFFGIVGRNGSGKSTLLKMIAGVYTPTEGSISVNGTLVPFIELGVGFNPELSGRDNVFLNGALLGFNRRDMEEMYEEIVRFAELEEHMDVKLKNFSSGMQVRLAFSIAIRAKTDILLIDEVLAVGDVRFQRKCYDYFRQLRQSKKTVILVSHDRNVVQDFCDRGVLIHDSRIISEGVINKIQHDYDDIVLGLTSASMQQTDHIRQLQVGAKISNLKFTSKSNRFEKNEGVTIEFGIRFEEAINCPIIGIVLKDKTSGEVVMADNSKSLKYPLGHIEKGDIKTVAYSFRNKLAQGVYTVEPAVASSDGTIFYDWVTDELELISTSSDNEFVKMGYDRELRIE